LVVHGVTDAVVQRFTPQLELDNVTSMPREAGSIRKPRRAKIDRKQFWRMRRRNGLPSRLQQSRNGASNSPLLAAPRSNRDDVDDVSTAWSPDP